MTQSNQKNYITKLCKKVMHLLQCLVFLNFTYYYTLIKNANFISKSILLRFFLNIFSHHHKYKENKLPSCTTIFEIYLKKSFKPFQLGKRFFFLRFAKIFVWQLAHGMLNVLQHILISWTGKIKSAALKYISSK